MSPPRKIRFIETIGKGGFGSVYLGEVQGRGGFVQRLAVKVLSEELANSADIAARHRDEARLLGLLNHDQIVKVFDMVELNGRPALLMEYVEGADCGALLREGPMSPRSAFEVAHAAAGALAFAWNTIDPASDRPLQVVHRDIKPANLLVSRHGGVKVLDFGIARGDFDREGRTESVQFGTARYMAPEQWLYTQSSDRVDIFALGMSVLELLAGRQLSRPPLQPEPFDAHLQTAIRMVTAQGWTSARMDAVRRLLTRMTAWEPGDRPDAREVHEACLELAEDLPGPSLARFAPTAVPPLIEARRRRYRHEPLLPPCDITAAPQRPRPAEPEAAKTERAPPAPPPAPPDEASATQPSAGPDPRDRLLGASPDGLSGPHNRGLAGLRGTGRPPQPARGQLDEADTEASAPQPRTTGPLMAIGAGGPHDTAPLQPLGPEETAPLPRAAPAGDAPAPLASASPQPAQGAADTSPLGLPAGAVRAPGAPDEEPATAQQRRPLSSQDPRYHAVFEALTQRGPGLDAPRAHPPSLYQALLAAERTDGTPAAAPPMDSVELRRSRDLEAMPPSPPRHRGRPAGMIAAAIAATVAVTASIGLVIQERGEGLGMARASVAAPPPPSLGPTSGGAELAEPLPAEAEAPTSAAPTDPEPVAEVARPGRAAADPARGARSAPDRPPTDPTTPTPAAPAAASAAPPTAAPAAAPAPEAAAVRVRFTSSPPGARVTVDGVVLGVTPTEPLPVRVGRRKITVSDGARACQSDLRISPVGANTVACDLGSSMLTRRH